MMYIVTFKTIINCIIISMAVNIAARLHQIFLPRSYSSILDFRYNGDASKTIRSSSIRLIYIALISIFFYLIGFQEFEIYCGMFISAFLNVWPAIVQYRLITIKASWEKIRLLFGYSLFVVFTTLFSYISLNIIYRSLIGDFSFGPFDSKGFDILFALFIAACSCSMETILSKFALLSKGIDIESFRIDKEILVNRIIIEEDIIDAYSYEIEQCASENNVPKELLKTLIILEYIHRGQWYIRVIEWIICRLRFSYPLAIKKDLSLGIAQIKISTAKDLLEETPYSFIRYMTDPLFSIKLCGKYIRKIIDDYTDYFETDNIYDYIASTYLSGTNNNDSEIVKLYSIVLESFDNRKIISFL